VSDVGPDLDVEPDADADAEVDAANRIPAATAVAVLTYLVKHLVDDPDAVQVDVVDRRRGVLLEVRVAPGELGRVIGRRGRTAQSIRTVVRAAATRDAISVDVDFVD
jgi:predicted RNA-binding protein YlqC (UPF0109 family)